MEPQPIETAPRDGTVVLTDCGLAFHHPSGWGWIQCEPHGNPFSCADDGLYYCRPNLWTPVPYWIK